MVEGGNYASLSAATSIWLLGHFLFPGTPHVHRGNEKRDLQSRRILKNAVVVHTVRLTTYAQSDEKISQARKLERSAFLLLHYQGCHAVERHGIARSESGNAVGSANDSSTAAP
jgi:hypothetical protein